MDFSLAGLNTTDIVPSFREDQNRTILIYGINRLGQGGGLPINDVVEIQSFLRNKI